MSIIRRMLGYATAGAAAEAARRSWESEDFVSAPEALQRMGIVELSSPPDMRRDCEWIEGTPEEKAEKLAAVFRSLQ